MQMTGRAQAMWRKCLASALRTALACTIVGATTLYGPPSLLRHVAFPAFSYVTVILIIIDASLGDTLRGCWLALYATCQSVGPAILSLWLIGPAHLSAGTTAIAVAVAGFVVVLPNESTHLVAKRIALGQIVLIYVIGYIKGAETQPIMHPLRVAASTAVGVAACVLALLLPFPRLASREVKQGCKEISKNTSGRLNLYVKAFCAEDDTSARTLISQAKILTRSASEIYQTVKRYQPSMKWERLPFKFCKSQCFYMNVGDKLQDMEIALRGMEMALTGIPSFPARLLAGEVKDGLKKVEERIVLAIKRSVNNPLQPSVTPESDPEKSSAEYLQTLQDIPGSHQDMPFYFFLFCLKLLESKTVAEPEIQCPKEEKRHEIFSKENENMFLKSWRSTWDSKRVMPAIKLSLSLGLAVLFGSMYSKENGYWSGLPVAISLAAAREATFKVANVKGQGTVIGTVYGVMGCFVFERFLPVRFLSLLPWFIFSSFLSKSRMYGQAGGISAVIGAVLILGRKNFGPPSEFAIARITETFIGLSCSITVELLLQPTRASTLAKLQLSRSFNALHDCVSFFRLHAANKAGMIRSHKKLKSHLNELKKFIQEAEAEPNFWFLPFNGSCFNKLYGSLSKMVDLLHFSAQAIGFLGEQETRNPKCKDVLGKVDEDLKIFRESLGPLAKSFEEITLLKSLEALEKALANNNVSWDLEMGKTPNPNFFKGSGSDDDASEPDKVMKSYLRHSRGVVEGISREDDGDQEENEDDGEEDEPEEVDNKSEVLLSLSGLGFCMKSMMKETREIEERVKELVQLENPSSNVDLHEISCKVRALCK